MKDFKLFFLQVNVSAISVNVMLVIQAMLANVKKTLPNAWHVAVIKFVQVTEAVFVASAIV